MCKRIQGWAAIISQLEGETGKQIRFLTKKLRDVIPPTKARNSLTSHTQANVPTRLVVAGIHTKTVAANIPTKLVVEGVPTKFVGTTNNSESCGNDVQ